MYGKNFNASWDPGGEQNVVAAKPSEPSSTDRSQALTLSSSAPLQAVRNHSRYGPRWLRERWLDDLKPWQVANLHLADEAAQRIGLPLNTFITISWVLTHPGFGAMPQTFNAGMNRLGMWLRRRGVRFAWIFVHENPEVPNTEDSRPNTHILLHVPRKLRPQFDAKVEDWFQASDHGVDIRSRRGPRAKLLHYMSKGAQFLTCRKYGGYRARGGQGRIEIKRSGVAQCLRHRRV